MDTHIKSMSGAYQNYIDAANAVLAEYSSAGGRKQEATNLALEKLREQRFHFLSACVDADGFIHAANRRDKTLEAAHETVAFETGLKNLHHMRDLLTLSYRTLKSCFNVMADQAMKLESSALIFLSDLTQDGDGAHVPGEDNMPAAAVPALSTPEQAEKNNTAAPEETEKSNSAALLETTVGPRTAASNTGLSEPDPKNAA